jgi:hypothetical protein
MQRQENLVGTRTQGCSDHWSLGVLLVLSLLQATGARAGETAADQTSALPTAPTLHLAWIDSYKLVSPRGHGVVAEEVGALFRDLGIEVAWSQGLPAKSPSAAVQLTVILMPCDSTGWGFPKGVLGTVPAGSGPPSRVFLFFPDVVRALGFRPPASRTRDLGQSPVSFRPNEEYEIARALGRVIAHEVIHALCPEQSHVRKGLMRARLDLSFLRQSRVSISPRIARRLRARLTPPPSTQEETVAAGSP